MGAAGARQPMIEFGGAQWAIVGGAGYLSLATEEGDSLAADLDVAVRRARLAVEATWKAGALAPYVQVGGRYDGGAGQTGAGLETVAGLRYTSERLEFEAQGRWLATHAAQGYEEYGGLARLAVKPLADGIGWQINVAPSWGAARTCWTAAQCRARAWAAFSRRCPGRCRWRVKSGMGLACGTGTGC